MVVLMVLVLVLVLMVLVLVLAVLMVVVLMVVVHEVHRDQRTPELQVRTPRTLLRQSQ